MKKLLLLLFIATISMNLFAEKVDRQNAETVAKNYYYQQYNLFKGELKFDDIVFTDVIEEMRNGEVALYVFNMENGYVVVSAEDAMTPVIGYSWEGPWPTKKEAHFEWFISEYVNNIEYLKDNAIEADFDIMNMWNMYSTDNHEALLDAKDDAKDVPVLVSATWNQDWPYNYYAPEDESSPANGRTYAGCVATAMSMIMYYWQYPEHGEGQRQYYQYPYGVLEADFENTYYAWDAMLDEVSSGSNQDAVKAIAELQYQCGIAVHMSYGPDGSGAYSPDVPASLHNYLRYNDAAYQAKSGMSNSQWETILVDQLDNGYPMYHSGTEPPSYGHAFVVDGYNYSSSYTFHFNFGWGGYGNGFFASTDAGGYTLNHAIVKNFYPTETYPNHATGLTELTKKVGRFTDGSGPLENYIDNNTASWLINPQTENDSIKKVTLYFDEFNLDGSDVIRVYDGADDTAPMLAEYTGNDTPSTLNSTGNQLFVVFETDGAGNAEGFVLRYSTIQHTWCNGTVTITEPAGTLNDGSEDKNYSPGSTCRFKIQPEWAANLTLSFEEFETVNEDDYLEIYDLGTSSLLATLYGSEIPDPVIVESGEAYIIWRTDNFDEAAGWTLNWTTGNVGIELEEAFNEFNLYPNPASEEVVISFETKEVEELTVQMISPDGKVVYSNTKNHFSGIYNNSVDVSNLAKGVYFLRLLSNEGEIGRAHV